MKRTIVCVALALASLALGCAADPIETGEAASIQAALESEDGELGYDDEAPLFGAPEVFEQYGIAGEDEAVEDPRIAFGEDEPAVEPDPGRSLTLVILWGQMPPDRTLGVPTRWDGRVAVTRGALVVRRTIRFEGPTDELLPRIDPRVVGFRSTTLPHVDGLILTVVDESFEALRPEGPDMELAPLPEEVAPALVIESEALVEPVVVRADELIGLHRVIEVDDTGNRMLIAAVPPPEPCPRGIVAGIWRRLRPELGTFHGRWLGTGGELHGHVRGIYGRNRAGERVLFGKYIGLDGEFRGLLRGTYGDGYVEAVWGDADRSVHGHARGRYVVAGSLERADGVFAGDWAATCNETVEAPEE